MTRVRRGTTRFSPERRARVWRAVLKKYGPYCQWCRELIDMSITDGTNPMIRSLDHIKPWSEGGTNAIDNLQPMHRKCNNDRAILRERFR